MSDLGHKMTDEMIEELEKKITREYQQAFKDVSKKLEDYMSDFKAKDAEMWKKVKDGNMTQEAYLDWRKKKMLTGRRWKEMKQTLAEDLTKVNEKTRSIIGEYMPDAYALNHNYATFAVEKASRLNTSYTLYNRETVEHLLKDDEKLLPYPRKLSPTARKLAERADIIWNREHLNSQITQGVLQGESIPDIAKRLMKVVGMNRNVATRNARTMMTSAENKGKEDAYDRLEEKGIELERQWVSTLDNRTRHSHRLMHGEVKDPETGLYSNGLKYPGDPDGEPEEVYNCFVGETKIATDSEVIRSYKHKYNGQIVSIKTAGGVNFSCTPNHPILTLSGWKPAESLHNGDDVLIAVVTDSVNSRRNPDVNHVFPRLDTIHDFSDVLGCERTGALGVNFHGDIATSEVEVIAHKGLLRDDRNAFGSKAFDKLILKLSDKSFVSKSSFMKHFWSVFGVTLRNVRFFCKSYPFFLWRVCHPDIHCLRPISWNDTTQLKDTIYRGSAVSGFLSESLNRRPCKVFVDNVVDVGISEKELHVYNLQTQSGYYFANENIDESCNIGMFIIAHNCRCSEIAFVKGHPIDIPKYSPKMTMSYEEWLGEHEEAKEAVSIEEPKKPDYSFGGMVSNFTPAKTREEAESYADQFVSSYKSKYSGNVSYKGVDIEYANASNKVLTEVFQRYNIDTLSDIMPMNKRENRWKDTTADASYQWGGSGGRLFFNASYYKNSKILNEHIKEGKDLLSTVLNGVDVLLKKDMSETKRNYIEALIESKVQCVAQKLPAEEYATCTFVHESGHMLDDKIFGKMFKEKGFDVADSMKNFGKTISGYAVTNRQEYIAESFASYWYGFDIDPELAQIFKEAESYGRQ